MFWIYFVIRKLCCKSGGSRYAVSVQRVAPRIRVTTRLTAKLPNYEINPEHKYWFSRIYTKLSAFSYAPAWALNQPASNTNLDLMRKAIANHRLGQTEKAINLISNLVTLQPKDLLILLFINLIHTHFTLILMIKKISMWICQEITLE